MSPLVFSLAALAILPAPGQATFLPEARPSFEEDNPLHTRNIARARFQAAQIDPQETKRARRDATRAAFHDRRLDFLFALNQLGFSRGVFDFLIESALDLMEAEQALNPSEEGRLRALEQFWGHLAEFDRENQRRTDSGHVDVRNYLRSRYYRLDAEIQRADLREKHKELRPWSGVTAADGEKLSPRDQARAKFAADYNDPADLRRARDQAALVGHLTGMMEWDAGRGTLNFVLDWSLRLLRADAGLAADDAELLTALERHWLTAKHIEAVSAQRYGQGRVAIQDLAGTQDWQRQAAVWLLEARARVRRPDARAAPQWQVFPELSTYADGRIFPVEPGELDPAVVRTLARAKAELATADPSVMKRECLTELRLQYDAREQEFLKGRGSLDFFLRCEKRLARLEYDLATDEAERHAARERHWLRSWQIDLVTQARFEAGRVASADYHQARFHRLGAELGLLPRGPRP